MTETSVPTPAASDTIEMRMTRLLPAGCDEVFDAYTDAEKQKVWFTILDETPGIVEITTDLRVGGQQTTVWGPDADTLFREVQTFVEIDRPHRLVTESVGSSPDGTTMTTRIEMTFEAHVEAGGAGYAGESTLVTVVQTGFPVPEVRDFFASEVWGGAFARIETYLTRGLTTPRVPS